MPSLLWAEFVMCRVVPKSVDLSGTINTLSNAHNWLEKSSYFRPIFFFNLFSVILGTHPWPVYLVVAVE